MPASFERRGDGVGRSAFTRCRRLPRLQRLVNMAIVTHRPIPAQAMGPGKESLRARKKLASVLF